jgi:DNA polymerase I
VTRFRREVSFDTETMPVRPGLKAPPMACLTWMAKGDEKPSIVHGKDPRARALFESWIKDPETLIVGHFVAFDLAVCAAAWPDLMPDIFDALEQGRVTDTMLREKLWDIALGRYRGFYDDEGVWHQLEYGLEGVAKRRAGMHLKKDGWRLRYGEFLDAPIEQWPVRAAELIEKARAALAAGVVDKDLSAIVEGPPEDAVLYPLTDARATLAVYLAQEEQRAVCDPDPFVDQWRQAQASWWLTLMCNWGVRTRLSGSRTR